MRIKIETIKINNFRSLEDVSLNLKYTSVLVGKNNCGKSNIVQAVVYGFTYSNIEKEDVFVSPSSPFTFDKKVQIDVKIIPVSDKGIQEKEFNEEWSLAFGENISIDSTSDQEFFAFRTEIKYDNDREQYVNKKYRINQWGDEGIDVGNLIKRDTFDAIENIFINAQRDISLDIRDKRSVWGKLTSNIKVDEVTKDKIDSQLDKLNKRIVRKSEILKSISKELQNTTADASSDISISPLTKDIETIYSGMNIYYKTENSTSTAVENLGLGIRSWAVFSTVKAQILSKINKAKQDEFAYFPLLLIEEPEAHVHPQAQRQLFSDVNEVDGQKIITTHSPYILSQIDLDKIIYISKNAANTVATPLLVEGLSSEDVRKIKRTVMNTRGEILYANAVILAEGETEEQALAVYLREYFDKEPFELGINIISVGGNNYLPFMRLLDRLNINWYVFSDGETQALSDLSNCIKTLKSIQSVNLDDFDNVFYLKDGHCFETYFIEEGYGREIKKAICEVENNPDYMTWFINHFHGQKAKKNKIRDYKSDGGSEKALLDCMLMDKTKYPTAIAEQIVSMSPKRKRIPTAIKELFDKIKLDFNK